VSKTWSENSTIQKVYEYKNEDNDIELAPTVSAVLDIADLGFERRIKFVNAFTKMVTMWHRKQGHKKAPQAFIFYEESHTYFPNIGNDNATTVFWQDNGTQRSKLHQELHRQKVDKRR
jgi:hypothetical protein